MPIREEPKCEFFYDSGQERGKSYFIEFKNNHVNFYKERGEKLLFSCLPECLGEVVDFLRKKGVIKQLSPVPTFRSGSKEKSKLSAPKINKKGDIEEVKGAEGTVVHMEPLQSLEAFNEVKEENTEEDIFAEEDIVENKAQEALDKEIKKRPVYKSRVINDGDDPLSAEKHAASLRKTNTKKTIKRASE